jgi:hypothetical protein
MEQARRQAAAESPGRFGIPEELTGPDAARNDGSERGLVSSVHHDAVMGVHHADAGPGRKRIP